MPGGRLGNHHYCYCCCYYGGRMSSGGGGWWWLVMVVVLVTGGGGATAQALYSHLGAPHPTSTDFPHGAGNIANTTTTSRASSFPQCQWSAPEVLECQVRTLEDTLGSQLVKGQWVNVINGTQGHNHHHHQATEVGSGARRGWHHSSSGASDSRHIRELTVECSPAFQSHITPHTFQGVEGLEQLRLHKCQLATLPPGSLGGLGRLRELEVISYNGEWAALELAEGSLPSSLERVTLAHNNIWSLPLRSFCGPLSMHQLDLSYNRLQAVVELGFGDPAQLEALALNSSNTTFSIHPSGFSTAEAISVNEAACGHALQELILDHNDFVRLPADSFRSLAGLRELYVRNNDIRLIASEAFRGMAALRVLYLSNNHIIALQNGTFVDNAAIERIYINNNSLTALNSGVFQGLAALQVLDLSGNNLYLDSSHDDLLKGLRRLVILDLSQNALATITQPLLRDLNSLQRLDLSHNSIQSLEDGSFSSLSNLYALDLSHNLVLSLGERSLRGLVGLSLLHLTNNSLIEIHPQAFRHSSNLKEVYLADNHLQAIPTALENLSFLKVLDVSKNDISTIQPFLFSGLSNLDTLNISHNRLSTISEDAFQDLTSLKTFDARDNHLRELNDGSFKGMAGVRHLILARNDLSDISEKFAGLEHLESLELYQNNIRMFDYAFIPRQLIKLDLSHNRIEKLGNYFKVHNVLTLEVLDASHNSITKLTEVSLPNTIRRVLLQYNNISKVLPNTFRDKMNVEYIDLRMNQLRRLNPKSISFRGTTDNHNSARVSLAGNPVVCDCEMEWLYGSSEETITTPEPTEVVYLQPRIDDLPHLTCTLEHSRGGGSTVTTQVINTSPENYLCPYATHCFALCNCCDFIACDCQMKCPDACSCYHDDTWSMNLVDCSGGSLERLPDRVPMDATVVLLDGNNLQVLHAHHFIGRHSIQQLYLNSSQIQTLQNRTFHGLTSLRSLHLQDNMIVQLNGFEFYGLQRLKELYLHNNRLSFINNATFMGLKSLEILRLDNNFITDLPVWLLSNNKFLITVSLANNPWDCDCQFVESLREWQRNQPDLLIDPEEVFCVHDSGVVGPSIVLPEYSCINSQQRVTQYQFGQRQLPFLAGGLCGGVALISALVVVAMLVARRKAAAANKLAMSSPPSYCQEEDGKVFDAYISYSNNDASFVRDVVATKLENTCPSYKLCLHSRDFSENSRLSEFITQSLNFSRRTIVVLSKNYVDSEWKNSIFKKAHMDGLKEGDMNVIAIYYDNVSYSSFDADLKTVIRRSSKLRWGDKHFWKKLLELMPQKQTYTSLPVYMSDNSFKSSTLPSLMPPSTLPLPSSSSVLTSTTGLTTPSEIDRRASYLPEPPAMYKAPPPPRPCCSPPTCDYIVMQGRDCRDPHCTCCPQSHAAYTFVEGDTSSLNTYASLGPFTAPSNHNHAPTHLSRPHSPSSEHYSSVIDEPIRRTVRASKRKKKRPQSQTYSPPATEDTTEDAEKDTVKKELPSDTFRRTKSLRVKRTTGERHSDYSTDHSSDRSSGRSFDHSVTSAGAGSGGGVEAGSGLYMGLTDSPPDPSLNTEECFV